MSAEFLATPIIEEAMTSDSEVPAMPATEEAQDPTQTQKSAPKQESWLDGTMRKWDCDTGLLVGQPWTGKGGCIHALALSPDGKTIACGRMDGSVQRWDTDSGKMIEDVWTGHSREVRSLSWSPSGDHIASGSRDGTILIRKLDSGQTEMDPIKTGQRWVNVLVYSPSGDKIASGGLNETICIWDTKTGELVLGPIEEQGASVTSLSKHNVLACVGQPSVAQLWDTESYEPLLHGRYLASSGLDKKFTQWVAKDMVPELTETQPQSPTPSCFDVDVTNPQSRSDVFTDDESDTSYGDCFQPYHPSAPSSGPYRRSRNHNLSPTQRFWNTITVPSRRHLPENESTALQPRPKHSLFAQYTGPQPVTVAAGGGKKWRPPVKTSTQTGQSSSTITQPTAQPLSMSRP
ncbi:WD40-repeat-containing domain protein [Suillus variegatus]|nr:WD40-repeat-containing domain protein [Suillus variegatus]